jgi:N-acetylneuraminic acid mutarotase
MKNLSISTILFFIALLSFTRCNEKGFPEASYPRIVALPVTDVSPEGAAFHARTVQPGTDEVINRGFVWGTDEGVTIANGEWIEVGAGDGDFDARVSSGLVNGVTYYVKAFVKTKTMLAYSAFVSFVSDGSFPPEINSISPSTGAYRDTVTIQGARFSHISGNNKVMFGDVNAPVIKNTESLIQCTVPTGIGNKPLHITVKVGTGTAQSTDFFTLKTPVITAFAPTIGTFGDQVTITGSNFGSSIYDNEVTFGTYSAEVISASAEKIIVKVPSSIREKNNIISVNLGGFKVEAPSAFAIAAPSITGLSISAAKSGDAVTITGLNFNPEPGASKVTLAGYDATVENVTATSIRFVIPVGVYDSRSLYPEVTVAEQTAVSPQELQLHDLWIRRSGIPDGVARKRGIAFSINGEVYAGLGTDYSNDVWRYSPLTNTWTAVAPFPGGARFGAVAFAIGNFGYVGLGSNGETDFWRYDPSTNNWAAISSFPKTSSQSVALACNGNGYVVISAETDNFWEYNPATNTWTKKADCSTIALPDNVPATGFTIDKDVYIYSSHTSGAQSLVSRYNTLSATWSPVASTGDISTTYGETGFAIGGKGYIKTTYNTLAYNPSGNTWRSIDDPNLMGYRFYSVAAQANNKIYFGFGENNYDWWEFDPSFE